MKGKKKSFAEKIKKEGWMRIDCHPLAVWFGSTIVTVLLLELLSRKSLFSLLHFVFVTPHLFLMNFMIVLTTYSLMFLTRRWGFVRGLVAIFWGAIGVTDFVLLLFRTTPFNWHDLSLIDSAMQVMNHYVSGIGFVAIGAVIAACIVLIVVLFKKAARLEKRPNYKKGAASVVAVALLTVYFWCVGRWSAILPRNFSNIAEAYQTYGLAYCFTNSYISTGISKPDNYDAQKVENILDEEVVPVNTEVEIDPVETTAPEEVSVPEEYEEETKAPIEEYDAGVNVIYLQLESFFDITDLNDVTVNEDPIPNYHRLFDTCSSGFLSVPSVGAGTANTEFESITGMSLRYFGPGEYPYKSILKETTCESVPYVLKNLGYSTHAVHNNEANFYGRRSVFPNLGFDTFTSEEYMADENLQNPLGWVKDSVLTDEIIKCLDSTDSPDYVYTISVQGHGDYPSEPILDNPSITVSGSPTDELNCKWEYYVNQIHEMDQFVKELTDALADYPEDVILVMYGDHLPTMGLTVEDLKNKYLFQTEYVIWDNMGLTKKDENLASYQIAAEVLDRVGIHEGTIMKYHQARRNTKNYQVDLETLQYDVLYGQRYAYGGENPFERMKMRMGLYDVTLDSIRLVSDTDWTYYIQGTNFTPSSQVKLNGEWYDTAYVSPNMLVISGTELSDFDRLAVVQRSNSSTRKALSKSFDRAVYALYDSQWKVNSR